MKKVMNSLDQIRLNQLYERHLTELTLQGKSKKIIEMYSRKNSGVIYDPLYFSFSGSSASNIDFNNA